MARITPAEAARLGINLTPGAPSRAAKAIAGVRKVATAAVRKIRSIRHRVGGHAPFEIAFVVPCEPKTKQRARTQMPRRGIERAFGLANGDAAAFRDGLKGLRHHTYTPAETEKFERLVAGFAAAAMRSRPPCETPVAMEVVLLFEGDPETWPTASSDPDIDNVEKAVMDALKGIVWTDDRLVVRKKTEKACAWEPGVHVVVRAV